MNDDRLERMEGKIDRLVETVATIAVQNQRLVTLERETTLIFAKLESLTTRLLTIEKFQASCPRDQYRGQINTLWVFVAGIGAAVVIRFFL